MWPVWGVHHLLEGAKKGALAGNAGHFKTLAARLHGAIERAELDGVKDWQAALGALELERQRLERLPTWPWRPEASRACWRR